MCNPLNTSKVLLYSFIDLVLEIYEITRIYDYI